MADVSDGPIEIDTNGVHVIHTAAGKYVFEDYESVVFQSAVKSYAPDDSWQERLLWRLLTRDLWVLRAHDGTVTVIPDHHVTEYGFWSA